jgi:hypothetical protein
MSHDKIDEYESDWAIALDIENQSLFFPEYPTKDTDMNDVYRDMAGLKINGVVTSLYLELGIRRMDAWMSREIRKGEKKSKYTKEQMEHMIKHNPHVHNIIKTNLLENLNNIWK